MFEFLDNNLFPVFMILFVITEIYLYVLSDPFFFFLPFVLYPAIIANNELKEIEDKKVEEMVNVIR